MFLGFACNEPEAGVVKLFIRTNQVGYLPNDFKQAVVFSASDLAGKSYAIVNNASNRTVTEGVLGNVVGEWGNFKYQYNVNFSNVRTPGNYRIEVEKTKSYSFAIGDNVYKGITDSLLTFLRVQRCGPTNPHLHGLCHNYDSPRVEGDPGAGSVDVTGGWHDAGDYTKFLSTIAGTTYLLLFTYEFDREAAEYDGNGNQTPDILEEARVGIDWLLRANYSGTKLISQVQDLRDHSVGWRKPEEDPLQYDRPAFLGEGKNLIGMFTAALALGSKIWKERFYDEEFSTRLKNVAENVYKSYPSAPDVDKNPSGMYQEKGFAGKLALGAVELYTITKNPQYLSDATALATTAGSDYWWSFGDMNALAHYRIAQYKPEYSRYIQNNLIAFETNRSKSIYGEGTAFSWGTTNTFLGITLQAMLYKKLTGNRDYNPLMVAQRDYVLGNNPWGVSFIYNIGSRFTRYFHSQIAYFNGGYFPGGVAAGPAPQEVLKNYTIQRENTSYDQFNSVDVRYYDDRNDYITNEPTTMTNATAIFVFTHMKKMF